MGKGSTPPGMVWVVQLGSGPTCSFRGFRSSLLSGSLVASSVNPFQKKKPDELPFNVPKRGLSGIPNGCQKSGRDTHARRWCADVGVCVTKRSWDSVASWVPCAAWISYNDNAVRSLLQRGRGDLDLPATAVHLRHGSTLAMPYIWLP